MWSRSREGRYGEVVPTSTESKLFSLLLPSHERRTLIESGHAAGTGGVGKLSRRSGTPNFVPCFFFLPREKPWLSVVMQQGGEGWGSCPDAQGLQTIFLLLPSHESIFPVESGHAVGRGGVGKLSRRPGTPNFVPCFFLLTRE